MAKKKAELSIESLYASLEAAFPPTEVSMLGRTVKCQQFQAQVIDGVPQVFLIDRTPQRLGQLNQVLDTF